MQRLQIQGYSVEINQVNNQLQDLIERSAALRGYL